MILPVRVSSPATAESFSFSGKLTAAVFLLRTTGMFISLFFCVLFLIDSLNQFLLFPLFSYLETIPWISFLLNWFPESICLFLFSGTIPWIVGLLLYLWWNTNWNTGSDSNFWCSWYHCWSHPDLLWFESNMSIEQTHDTQPHAFVYHEICYLNLYKRCFINWKRLKFTMNSIPIYTTWIGAS